MLKKSFGMFLILNYVDWFEEFNKLVMIILIENIDSFCLGILIIGVEIF